MRFIQLFAISATLLSPILALPQNAELDDAIAIVKSHYNNISDADAQTAATGLVKANHVLAHGKDTGIV